jgi:hypothetical protein
MLLNRTPVYRVLLLCLITVYMLFYIKDSVMSIRAELREVSKQMQYESDTIHILKAELAYLTSPERLKRLSSDYLGLKDTKISQMISDPLNTKKEKHVKQLASSQLKSSNIKWRYKKGPNKYLTMVSSKE